MAPPTKKQRCEKEDLLEGIDEGDVEAAGVAEGYDEEDVPQAGGAEGYDDEEEEESNADEEEVEGYDDEDVAEKNALERKQIIDDEKQFEAKQYLSWLLSLGKALKENGELDGNSKYTIILQRYY